VSGARWRFEVPIVYASTAAYKVVEIDAFSSRMAGAWADGTGREHMPAYAARGG